MAHPPRSNPPLRSSSGPPSPCITPSTETLVLVVSFMVGAPFSLVWSSFGRTVSQNLAHLLPPSIRVPSMVPGPGQNGIHRKLDRVGRVLRGPSDTCSASFAGHRHARLPKTPYTRSSENSPSTRLGEYAGRFVGRDTLATVDYAPRLREHTPMRQQRPLEGEKGGTERQRARWHGRHRHRRRQRHGSRLRPRTRGTGLRGGANVHLGQGRGTGGGARGPRPHGLGHGGGRP